MNRIRLYILQAVARIINQEIDTDQIRSDAVAAQTTEQLADIEENGLTQADTDQIDAELTRLAQEDTSS